MHVHLPLRAHSPPTHKCSASSSTQARRLVAASTTSFNLHAKAMLVIVFVL